MHMDYENSVQFAKQRQQQHLQHAEQWRTAATNKGNHRQPIYGPMLAQTGKLMVNLGKRLVARYDEALEEITPPLQDPCAEEPSGSTI